MSFTTRSLVTILNLAVVAVAGCHASQVDVQGSPEDVYRRFLIANLTGQRAQIEPLILPNPDAALLWPGQGYPPEVAKKLTEMYRAAKMSRSVDGPDRVVLTMDGDPRPTELRRVNGAWRVDASPIIEFRKRAQAARKQQGSRSPDSPR